jgi:hypothetical protein
MTTRQFELYPEERHWWSFNDYGAVVDVVRRLKAASGNEDVFRVVEFGPGSSTLALIEGGATHIDAFETDPHWADVHAARLAAHLDRVDIYIYGWSDPLQVTASLDRYDLAFVDGPVESERRVAVVRWCLEHALAVLVPADEPAGRESPMKVAVMEFIAEFRCRAERLETGPLAGSFMLLWPGQADIVATDEQTAVHAAPGVQVGGFVDQSVGAPLAAPKLSRKERRAAAKGQA